MKCRYCNRRIVKSLIGWRHAGAPSAWFGANWLAAASEATGHIARPNRRWDR